MIDKMISDQEKTIDAEPYNGDLSYIFVSYKHKNKETGEYAEEEAMALRIINRMRQDGYRVWYDNEIVPAGEYDEDIEEHIDKCEVFMALISKAYFNSYWCKNEISHACDQNKTILPVRIEDVDYPKGLNIRLSRIQHVDRNKFKDENDFYNKIYSTSFIKKCLGSNLEFSTGNSETQNEDKRKEYLEFIKSLECIDEDIKELDKEYSDWFVKTKREHTSAKKEIVATYDKLIDEEINNKKESHDESFQKITSEWKEKESMLLAELYSGYAKYKESVDSLEKAYHNEEQQVQEHFNDLKNKELNKINTSFKSVVRLRKEENEKLINRKKEEKLNIQNKIKEFESIENGDDIDLENKKSPNWFSTEKRIIEAENKFEKYEEMIREYPDNMKYRREYVEILHQCGKECLRNEELDRAKEIFKKEFELTFDMGGTSLDDDTVLYLHSLMGRGYLYFRISDYDSALNFLNQSLEINEKLEGYLSGKQTRINAIVIYISILLISKMKNPYDFNDRYYSNYYVKLRFIIYAYCNYNSVKLDSNNEFLIFSKILGTLDEFVRCKPTDVLWSDLLEQLNNNFFKTEIIKYL